MSTLFGRARRARRDNTPSPQPADQREVSANQPQAETVPPTPQPTPENETGAPAPTAPTPARRAGKTPVARTRVSVTWVATTVAVLVLVFLLIFILQNLTRVHLTYLGVSGYLPIGVAMLLAAVAGALSIALIGTARILQLRHTAHRSQRR
ncbi:lipopolysaccharide assembly protein LapA domain-containing protein [Nocardia transvalensis]|uniref:lipopolysaccharide assembly protein LapA domain-containing protein n=1 Tax=Nocardia transvalensis TaxID=37333 RepID=UPI0018931337|nr:lipopolysaccharide assembly protein LapA domain-containing protein [Nocardia transvalensis]MBF6333437.1 DUF1049 domain-containing protein [Nocardia transvalensis]